MRWYMLYVLALALSLVLALALALMMWWQWASQMTDYVVCKSNDWLMRWYGNALCLALALALSLVLVLLLALTDDVGSKSNDWLMWWQWASQMTAWSGGRGQVKWLTDVVYGNALCLALSLVLTSTSSDWWCGGSGQVKWLTDVVAGGKSNDCLTDWCV